jgi:hypothetical protein
LPHFAKKAEKASDSNQGWEHVMGYLELGVLSVCALGILGFAFALAWIDAAPRKARETGANKSGD